MFQVKDDKVWENYKIRSFTRIHDIVTSNVVETTLKQQLHDNKHITALYLSQISYLQFDAIRKKMKEFGAQKLSLYEHSGTQGFFAEFEDLALVSFRGTQLEQSQDLKDCFTFWKRMYYDIKAHKGFANGIEKLVPNVVADLQRVPEHKHIIYTGHSLGGALSTLLAVAHQPDELVTFGAPRVASGEELSMKLEGVEVHRIVTSWDLVRWLPPDLPFLPYQHVGNKRVLPVPWAWNPKKFIHPHLLVTYLNALLEEEDLN